MKKINTYKELFEFSLSELHSIPNRAIASFWGMSHKSMYQILQGKYPGPHNRRQISGVARHQFNIEIIELTNNKIKVDMTHYTKPTQIFDNSAEIMFRLGKDKQITYLLGKLMLIEKENRKLKLKVAELEKLLLKG